MSDRENYSVGELTLGGTLITSTAAELNALYGITSSVGEMNLLDASVVTEPADGVWAAVERLAKAEYDFAVDGGAISAIDLGVTIPDNAIIVGGFVEVITTCTSATDAGTGALSILSANDLVTATAISAGGDIWDAGMQDIVPDATGSTAIKLTSAKAITFTIAVEAFTAGKFNVWLRYVMGE